MEKRRHTLATGLRRPEVVATDAITNDAFGLLATICLRQEATRTFGPLLVRHALVAAATAF